MPEFLMLMKRGAYSEEGEWGDYIQKLRQRPEFRGGSSLGNGVSVSRQATSDQCIVTGFLHFEADTIAVVRELLAGNPLFEAGGEIEILELIED
jgi:hypothetical protein